MHPALLFTLLLAQSPAPGTPPSDPMVSGAWVTGFVVAVIGAVFAGVKVGQSKKVKVGPQPFEIAVQDKYVSRAECLACKNDMRSDVREMRVLYDKTVTLFQDNATRVSDQIKEFGERVEGRFQIVEEGAAERRRRIHDKLNEHADLLSRIDARTDVSKSIGRLGSAIMTLARKEPN